MTRIYRDKTLINPDSTRAFFEDRGQRIDPAHPLTSILYQDNNPALAEQRDKHEKSVALPLLRLSENDTLLDVGCGIGRWADAVSDKVKRYHGIDFSDALIQAARSRVVAMNASFQQLGAEDVSPAKLEYSEPYSKVIISGLLIYLNDESVRKTLEGVECCCGTNARIYVREPVGIGQRLTLSEYWSDELATKYSAIYRTEDELLDLSSETLLNNGFALSDSRPLYPDNLNNRTDTQQYVFIFDRT